jgi:cyclic pyranopterin phosphate synthase
VSGIVLAGGRSRRMGRDKARLPYGGTTLLNHVARILADVCAEVIVVAEDASDYEDMELPPGARVVGDLYPGRGPLGGIVTGLRAAGEGVHVVVACDMPRIRPEMIRFLFESADGSDAAVPEIDGRLEPLCAAYHFRCADELESRLLADDLSLQSAVRTLQLNVLNESDLRTADPDLSSLINLNTTDDYMADLTHVDERGHARMVDVSAKSETARIAVARGKVLLSPATVALLRDNAVPKGDAIATARIAGIMAAKKTSDLIPLCHPLPITHASVELTIVDDGVEIEAVASITGRTGVEMESLTAVSVAALTLYDMVKAVDKAAVITDIRLERKTGGKSGEFRRAG